MTEREQQANDKLQQIARDIDKLLPDNFGFCLLAYEFGNNNRRLMYVSNSERQDVVNAMKEFIDKTDNGGYGRDV